MYASDHPHWDSGPAEHDLGLAVPEQSKQNILGGNAQQLLDTMLSNAKMQRRTARAKGAA